MQGMFHAPLKVGGLKQPGRVEHPIKFIKFVDLMGRATPLLLFDAVKLAARLDVPCMPIPGGHRPPYV
jgi:hypothetical protein